MNTHASVVDVLIENITTDQQLLDEVEQKVQDIKTEKREVTDRLKGYHNDLSVLLKYADETQRAKIEELGLSSLKQDTGLNRVASVALELLMKAKDKSMTNGDLYEAYVKTFKNKDDAVNYTQFNINCRPLFNTQRVIRTKPKDATSSREHVISINVNEASDPKKEDSKKKS